MKIFVDSELMGQSAYFGWQDKDEALYGLREGYKNSADDLVEIAVNSGNNVKVLDTYIFPILFSYRHCLEISLKHSIGIPILARVNICLSLQNYSSFESNKSFSEEYLYQLTI